MSTATQHAEAIILLDHARELLLSQLSPLGPLHHALTLLLRRIPAAMDCIPEENRGTIREQAERALAFSVSLQDFREYLDEPRAWAPAKEDVS